jgi:hypothetical protein
LINCDLIMGITNTSETILTDLPPEIHYLICEHMKSATDKFNFAISSVVIYNSLDVDKISHMMKMKPTINQIKSIIYKIDKQPPGVYNGSSSCDTGQRRARYVFWRYGEKNGVFKSIDSVSYLNCYTYNRTEPKNICVRVPITKYSLSYKMTKVYTLKTFRSCAINWSTCVENGRVMCQLSDTNLLI